MNNVSDFYDTLDLKYPEIGIAMQDIDRINPGKVKFIVPILTPNMDTSKLVSTKERQDTTNLMNADNNTLNIQDLSITNYIEIPVPSELCADINEFNIISGTISLIDDANISNAHHTGTGTIHVSSTGVDSIDVNGSISGKISITDAPIKGQITVVPTNKYRYIPKGSKWIIVFVGGDITKPRVISRYLED